MRGRGSRRDATGDGEPRAAGCLAGLSGWLSGGDARCNGNGNTKLIKSGSREMYALDGGWPSSASTECISPSSSSSSSSSPSSLADAGRRSLWALLWVLWALLWALLLIC
jgi:hypothetical protein